MTTDIKVISFLQRSKEAQENFLQIPTPNASDVAYYTQERIYTCSYTYGGFCCYKYKDKVGC